MLIAIWCQSVESDVSFTQRAAAGGAKSSTLLHINDTKYAASVTRCLILVIF